MIKQIGQNMGLRYRLAYIICA